MPIPRREMVLVVDDEPVVADVFRAVLSGMGYHVNVATSARDAEACLAVQLPDLILLDLFTSSSAEASGYEFCEKLKRKASTRNIPLVICTAGEHGPEHLLRAAKCGVDAFVTKPLEMEDLHAVIREQLTKRGWLKEHLHKTNPKPGRRQRPSRPDVFICHATEDKGFVKPLAEQLRSAGVGVWYDDFSLQLGDSLRRSIEKGLACCRHGVVVLSPHFARKEWPQRELDMLVSRERSEARRILPIWLNLSFTEVLKLFPMLADRVAARSDEGMAAIVQKLVMRVRPDLIR